MRIITVRQPWAWAIIHGGKDVENRVRNIAGDYTGLVAIHAGLRFDLTAPKSVQGDFADHPYATNDEAFGSIIGVVDLVGTHRGTVTSGGRLLEVMSCYRAGKPFGLCSTWAEHNRHHLELANPRPLNHPIPYKGALGLRTLPDEVAALIELEMT